MGVVFRQSVKTTIITFFGALLGAVLVLFSTNMIPKQELGFRGNLTNQTVVATFFILVGMSNTLFLYFHRFDGKKEANRRAVFLSLCFLVPLAVFMICMVPYFLCHDFLLHYFQEKDRLFMKRYILCFPFYTLFYLYTTLLEHYLLTQIKSAAASFVREVLLKGLHLAIVLLYGFKFIDYTAFIYSFVFINLIAVAILWMLARKNESFRFSREWHLFSREEYKEIFRFSGYHAVMGLTISLIGFLDGILLAGLNHDGLNAVPIYLNAHFISSVMTIPYRSMNGAASADINKSYALKEHAKVEDAYSRSSLNILVATVFMMILIVCNLHNAVALMISGYEAVFTITLILILGKLVDSATGLNDVALNMSPFYRLNFYCSVGLVFFMVIFFRILIPQYGVYGAAWVYSGSLVLVNIIKSTLVYQKMGLTPLSRGTGIVILIGAVVIGLVLLIPHLPNPYLDTLMRSVLICALYAALIIWLKPSKDITHYLAEIRKKKRLF